MIHPDTTLRFISSEIGHGIVATRHIPRGTITWVRDHLDLTFSREEFAAQPAIFRPDLEKYSFVAPDGRYVLCWDLARFINHSCRPACLSAGYDFEIALRDIHPGEELTDDYGSLNVEDNFECKCGTDQCRRTIRPDDLLRFADRWDASIADAFPLIAKVKQPLWSLVAEKRDVERALAGKTPIASCRVNYYSRGLEFKL